MSSASKFIWAKIVGGEGAVPFSCLKVGERFLWPAEAADSSSPKTKLGAGRYSRVVLGIHNRICRCRQGTAVIPIKD